jgi:hypothetical protein
MKAYTAPLQQATIYPTILGAFTAEGFTRQEALTQPRRAEVIWRHNPFATSPYTVTLSSPAFAFDGSGPPMQRDHTWNFATFNEARAWFDELCYANADTISERQQPPKREPHNGTVPWKVGDAVDRSRFVPYDIWSARIQSIWQAAGNSRADMAETQSRLGKPHRPSEPQECEGPLPTKRWHKFSNRRTPSRSRGTFVPRPPSRPVTMVRRIPICELASKCESFFSFGN